MNAVGLHEVGIQGNAVEQEWTAGRAGPRLRREHAAELLV